MAWLLHMAVVAVDDVVDPHGSRCKISKTEVRVWLFKTLDGGAAPHGGSGAWRTDLKTVNDNKGAPHGSGNAGFTYLGTEVDDRV
jgi:hypothetical protein